jgi:hypothetical protein
MSFLLDLQSTQDPPGAGPTRTLTVLSSASMSVCSLSTFSLALCAG